MQEKIAHVFQKVQRAVSNYPFILAMSVVMSAAIVAMIESESANENFWLVKVIICSSIGISLLFSLKMLSQRIGKTLLLQLAGILFLIGYYFILPVTEEDFSEVHIFLLIPTYILSHLMVAFIPFLNQSAEITFWEYNKNLFVNFILTVIFTGVLTAGVMLAIVAVEQLFGLDFRENIYPEIFFVLSICGSTLIFLLFSEGGLGYLEKDGVYPVVLKFFTQFILIPLLLIYVVILYFYAGKILLRWELPEGWVSYLILAYSIIGILAILLVHPLRNESARSWVKVFSNLFYYTLSPLLVLLFVAIATRILEYGYTEARYFVVLIAVWLLCVVIYFIAFRKNSIKFIPVSLFIFGLFALIFPYLNVFSVAIRSQKNQLELLLDEHKILDQGKIKFDKNLSTDAARNISDKFRFLSVRKEYDYLSEYLPKDVQSDLIDDTTWNIRSRFTNVIKEKSNEPDYSRVVNSTKVYEISDYRYLVAEEDLIHSKVSIDGTPFMLTKNLHSDKTYYKLALGTGEEIDLLPQIKKLYEKYHSPDSTIETKDLYIEFDLGKYHIKVVFDLIDLNYPYGKDNLNFYDAKFMIK